MRVLAAAVLVLIAVSACSSAGASPGGGNAAAAQRHTAAAAQPQTAAAASAAAQQYLGLYSAGQFGASYALLAPSARRAVSEHVWAAVHEGCPSPTAGAAYDVKHVTLTGSVAVVTVALNGAASALGSENISMVYAGGKWGYAPPDLTLYHHGTVKADVAAAKARGYCAGS